MRRIPLLTGLIASAALLAACATTDDKSNPMSFFVTSTNMGNGANPGGLEGADKHCAALAKSAGAGSGTWRAYLSTTGANSVNARDRTGLDESAPAKSWNSSHANRGCDIASLNATGGDGDFYCCAAKR